MPIYLNIHACDINIHVCDVNMTFCHINIHECNVNIHEEEKQSLKLALGQPLV